MTDCAAKKVTHFPSGSFSFSVDLEFFGCSVDKVSDVKGSCEKTFFSFIFIPPPPSFPCILFSALALKPVFTPLFQCFSPFDCDIFRLFSFPLEVDDFFFTRAKFMDAGCLESRVIVEK